MATMSPPSLDDIEKPVPPSEKIVFEKLEKLHNDITVVWSVSWTERRSDKEADFVIIDPRWPSILVLEVKGGKISLEEGQWYSTDRKGQKHKIYPVEQAMKGSYEISERIEKSLGQYFTFGWGVVFTDVRCPKNMSTEGSSIIPRERVIDIEDLESPVDAIDRVFKEINSGITRSTANKKFAEDAFGAIRPTYDFVRSISSYMRENEEKWIQLEPAQMQAFYTLKANKRGLIYGAAGTGKTVIATKAAEDAAKNDKKKVLYLCFNAPLAAAIYSRIKREGEIYNVYTYNGLCSKIVDTPNPDVDAVLIALKNSRDGFSDANAIRRARRTDEFYWDVVIVDEGQDFRANSWPVIEGLVEDDGSLYVFYDPYQAIAGKLDDSIIPVIQKEENIPNVPLYCNYRNTAKIGEVANKLIIEEEAVPEPLLDMAPEGAPVKYMLPTEIHDMDRLVKNEVETWIEGGIPKNGIAVLTANHIDSCQRSYENIYELCKNGFLQDCYENNKLPQDRPTLISIERFKGLEADAVVLVVPTNSAEEYWKIHYVGVSRARQFLTVMKVPLDPAHFKTHLESELENLIQEMTKEQIEECSKTGEIPEKISKTILIKMKALNNKEEQNNRDKCSAFECFWKIFHNRDIDLLERLVQEMTEEQIKKCCYIREREIPKGIRMMIDNKMSDNTQADTLFWDIFDKRNYEKVLESELERLVQEMTEEQIKKCCDVPVGKRRDPNFFRTGHKKNIRNEVLKIEKFLNRSNYEYALKSFWDIFDKRNYEKVLESELERLVQEMTEEQIEECSNLSDGTREIPPDICKMILAKMKMLNNKEEQDHSDQAYAVESFWTIFDTRFDFLKDLESELERLVQEMTYDQIKKCYNVKQPQKEIQKQKKRKPQKKKAVQKTREIPEKISTMIEEQDHHSDQAYAIKSFWTIFDTRFDFLKDLESELERLVQEMTYKQIEKCHNVQGNDGTREIPPEIRTTILTEMKMLNDKEEQDHNDQAYAIESFWTIFDMQFSDFMKKLPDDLTLELKNLVKKITYEEFCEMSNIQAEENGTREIPPKILKKISKKIGRAVLSKKKNKQIVCEYFWTIFDESKFFYYDIRKRFQ